ncbi:MAG: APC family permease [Janthinobacterium lividum]
MSTEPQAGHELPRVLGARHAMSIVVGIIIGSGIFLVPREMIAAVGSSRMVYLVWIAGGLLSLFGALTYAEIAAGRPAYGGEYAFLREAYGDLVGFLHMWTWWTIAKPASIASVVSGLVRTLATFATFAIFNQPAFLHMNWGQVAGLVALWLVTALDIVGTRKAADVQLGLTVLKVVLIAIIAVSCFAFAGPLGSAAHFASVYPGARGGLGGFMVALIAALWAYDGWSDVAAVAGEIKQPQRNLPTAFIGGILVVAGLYMLTNAAIQYVLPAAALAGADRPAADTLRVVLGSHGIAWGASLVSIGMAISISATLVGTTLSGSRIGFAAARDGLFFRSIARVHPKYQTPAVALIAQSGIASVLIFAIGRFQALFSLAIFAEWITYGLAVSTVFVFRKRDAITGRARAFSTPGYPVIPIVFILASVALTVFQLVDDPRNTLLGCLVILCGVPLYFYFKARRTTINPTPAAR